MKFPQPAEAPLRPSLLKRDPALIPALSVLWISLALFVLYPLGRLFLVTFTAEGQFTFGNLASVLDNWYDRQAFLNSLLLAFNVCLACGDIAVAFIENDFGAIQGHLCPVFFHAISQPFTFW